MPVYGNIKEYEYNVGIGSTTPTHTLDVFGSLQASNIVVRGAYTFPITDGLNNQVLTTDGSGNVGWSTIVSSFTQSSIEIGSDILLSHPGSILFVGTGGTLSENQSNLYWDNSNIRLGIGTSINLSNTLTVSGTGRFDGLQIGDYSLPASDGLNNQVLTTDGSGNVGWSTAGGGLNEIYVAASDCPNAVKYGAQYICDGINDEEEIQSAIDLLTQSGGSVFRGGVVKLSAGSFYVSSPITLKDRVSISGSGEGSTLVKSFNSHVRAPDIFRFVSSYAAFGTASSGTTTTLTDNTKSWTVNSLVGKILSFTHGAGVGQHAIIASNTSNTIVFEEQSVPPDITTEYVVSPSGASVLSTGISNIDISFDVSVYPYSHNVVSATYDTITQSHYSWKANSLENYSCFIMSGNGAGQVRRIQSNTNNTVYLWEPWDIIPDSTSVFVIGGNAISFYGGRYNEIVFENLFITSPPSNGIYIETGGTIDIERVRTLSGPYGACIKINAPPWCETGLVSVVSPCVINSCKLYTARYGSLWIGKNVNNIKVTNSDIMGTNQHSSGVRISGGNHVVIDSNKFSSSNTSGIVVSGLVLSSTSTSLTAQSVSWSSSFNNYVVNITGGTGANQRRRILYNNSDTIYIDVPWNINPDSSSTFNIKRMTIAGVKIENCGNNIVISNNIFDCSNNGILKPIWNVDGTSIVVSDNIANGDYDGGFEFIYDENTSSSYIKNIGNIKSASDKTRLDIDMLYLKDGLEGGVVFVGTGGTLSENQSNLYWDNTSIRLGIGTSTNLSDTLTVSGTGKFNGLQIGDYSLPASDGLINQVLTTDGSGNVGWSTGFNNFLASAYGIKVSEGTTYRLVRLPYSNGDQTLKFIFKRAEFHVETSPTENSARTIILKNGVPITDYIDIVAGEYDSEVITFFDDEYGYSGDVISFEATSVSMSDLWEINLQMISEIAP